MDLPSQTSEQFFLFCVIPRKHQNVQEKAQCHPSYGYCSPKSVKIPRQITLATVLVY